MRSLSEMVCGVATTIFNPEKPGRLTGVMRRTGEGHVEVDNSQGNGGSSKRGRASTRGRCRWNARSAISTAIGALASEKDAIYVKNFIDYEVSSINVKHVDVRRFT